MRHRKGGARPTQVWRPTDSQPTFEERPSVVAPSGWEKGGGLVPLIPPFPSLPFVENDQRFESWESPMEQGKRISNWSLLGG